MHGFCIASLMVKGKQLDVEPTNGRKQPHQNGESCVLLHQASCQRQAF